MPKAKKRKTPDATLVFTNQHFSFSLRRIIRTESTDGWCFYDDKRKNIGTLIAVEEQADHWYVHGSFTITPDADKFCEYLISFLSSTGIHDAFVSVHTGGKETISSSFEE